MDYQYVVSMKPDFSYEKKYWKRGYHQVFGIDEVGRGAFAGPVVAAAVALRTKDLELRTENKLSYLQKIGINDSKKLSPKKREKLAREIKTYFYFGIGQASVAEINRLGIVKATERAMRHAIKYLISRSTKSQTLNSKQIQNLNFQNPKQNIFESRNANFGFSKQTQFVLIDAFHVKYLPGIGLENQRAIVKGDEKSISIAAASILAKVYRDGFMKRLSLKYPKYHWGENKGYGTENHIRSIRKYGITRLHRKKFVENYTKQSNNN